MAFDYKKEYKEFYMPDALQDVNTKIYTEWLSALKEYEFAAGYCVEYYDSFLKGFPTAERLSVFLLPEKIIRMKKKVSG